MEDETRIVDVAQMFNEGLVKQMDIMAEHGVGDKEYKDAVSSLEKLYKLRIEENKAGDDLLNNSERREMDLEIQQQRLEFDRQVHKEKLKIESKRLELDQKSQDKDFELRQQAAKSEKTKFLIDTGTKVATLGAWLLMSFKVMKFEETGVVRSKAFLGVLPKLKFW